MVLKEIDWEPDSAADYLDKVERYALAFESWGFDVVASISGPNREDAYLRVRGPRRGLCVINRGKI